MCTQVRSGLSESQRKELGSGGADRWWHISYVGEHGSDAGGLFRDSLSALAAELLRGAESGAAGSGADFRGGSVGGEEEEAVVEVVVERARQAGRRYSNALCLCEPRCLLLMRQACSSWHR